jgi:hypothetical protein
MTIARELAEFLTRTSSFDLPRQAVEHAAMLIASTIASAAMGAGLESSEIIRTLARERRGSPEASVWFASGPKLPVSDAAQVNAVMSDAAASDDSDLRNIVHAGTTLVASALAMAERTGESGANLTSSIMLGYARSDSGPCRLGPTHAVIALVSAPGSTLADSHVAGPRGRSEEWYYKRGFWPRPFHYTEENRQRMLDPIEADD